jgi:hypothetical protein
VSLAPCPADLDHHWIIALTALLYKIASQSFGLVAIENQVTPPAWQ